MGEVGVAVVHVLVGGGRGRLSGNEREPGAVTEVDSHDEPASYSHTLRVYHGVAVHGGNGRVNRIPSHQHDVSEHSSY